MSRRFLALLVAILICAIIFFVIIARKRKYPWRVIKGWIIGLLIVFAGGLVAELCFNFNLFMLDSTSRGEKKLDFTTAILENMYIEDGDLVLGEGKGSVMWEFSEPVYIHKFQYDYDMGLVLYSDITIHYVNSFGTIQQEKLQDANRFILKSSTVNLDKKIKSIELSFDQVYKGLRIHSAMINNQPHVNYVRILFIWAIMFSVVFLWINRKFISEHIEVGFITLALPLGLALIFMLPANKVSWDEDVHFKNAYLMSFSENVMTTPVIRDIMDASVANWPFEQPQSIEEKRSTELYLDQNTLFQGDYPEANIQQHRLPGINTPGYVGSAIFINIARIIKLPFSELYRMGRMGNLFVYILVIFFAIRRICVGKHLMAVLALTPTAMMLACTYSYDATVIAFIFLGMAYLISEFIEKDKVLQWRNLIIIVISFLIGCAPKAVYIPLILLVLFLPNEKFKDKKAKCCMYIVAIAACIILMSTFVLPNLFNPPEVGDTRGGNTSNASQIQTILSHPLAYIKMFITDFMSTIVEYTTGYSVIGIMGHITTGTFFVPGILLLFFVAFTENNYKKKWYITKRLRLGIIICLALVIVLIWTALYINFTPVGEDAIQGVQGRYYLPLLFMVYLMLSNSKINCIIPKIYYTTSIMLSSGIVLVYSIYSYIFSAMDM